MELTAACDDQAGSYRVSAPTNERYAYITLFLFSSSFELFNIYL